MLLPRTQHNACVLRTEQTDGRLAQPEAFARDDDDFSSIFLLIVSTAPRAA